MKKCLSILLFVRENCFIPTPTSNSIYTYVSKIFFLSSLRLLYMSRVMRKPFVFFAYAKTKTQISFAVTAKLICAFVFATRILQSFYFLNPKFQTSCHFLRLCSPVCVRPKTGISERGSYINGTPMYGRPAQTPTTQPFLKLFCSRI